MILILTIVVVGMAIAAVVALSLGRALRHSESLDDDEERMAQLGTIESPTGKPFFPDRKAALDLSHEIHDVERGA